MKNRIGHSERLRSLHLPGDPLVLVNVWDAGSASAVEESGAAVIATSSWAIAAAHGYPDGETIPVELMMSTLERIAERVSLPLTVDIESGYGGSPAAVASTVRRVLAFGASGCNLEDSRPDGDSLRPVGEQGALIRAAREAAEPLDPGFFLNARTDVFLQHSALDVRERLDAVIERARAYADAGADGLFVPGLTDAGIIGELVGRVPLPVNVMITDMTASLEPYRSARVARISFGPAPYLQAMSALKEAAANRVAA